MSLEEALNANTAALTELITVLKGSATLAQPTGVNDVPKDLDKPKAPKPKAEKPKAEKPKVEEKPAVPPYETVKAAVLNVKAVKGMEAAKALLAQFGVKTLPEVKPEKLADVLTAAEKELA